MARNDITGQIDDLPCWNRTFQSTNGNTPYPSDCPANSTQDNSTTLDLESHQYYTVTALIIIICSFLSAIGNSIVMGIIISKPALQTVTHLLIVNLSATHLLSSVFCSPILAVTAINDGDWPMGEIACKIVHVTELVLSSGASLTLSAIAIDRYFSVVHHINYRMLKKIKAKVMIVSIWVLSIIICLPNIATLQVVQDVYGNNACIYGDIENFRPDIYTACYFCLTIFIPVLISCFAYMFVWRTFRHSQKRVSSSHRNKRNSATPLPTASKTEIRLIKMLFIMVFCFILFLAPWTVVSFHAQFNPHPLSENTVLTAQWFSRLQLVMDPIIYGYLNKTFRKSLCEACHFCPLCGHVCHLPSTVDSPRNGVSSNRIYNSAPKRAMPSIINIKTDESGKVSILKLRNEFLTNRHQNSRTSQRNKNKRENGPKAGPLRMSSGENASSSVIINEVIKENIELGTGTSGKNISAQVAMGDGLNEPTPFEKIMEYHNMEYKPLERTFSPGAMVSFDKGDTEIPHYKAYLPPIKRPEPRRQRRRDTYLKRLARRKRNAVSDHLVHSPGEVKS